MNDLEITRPAMPFALKHRKAIAPFIEESGKVVSADVHGATDLIPLDDCGAIIKELTAAMHPCDNKDALVLAAKLVGCYRVKDVVDPAIYVGTIAEMFSAFPPDIGERTRKEIVGAVKWVPTPAEVKETGDRMMKERRMALFAAQKHRDEHYRRKAIAEHKAKKEAEKGEYAKDLENRYAQADLEWPGIEKASIVDVMNALISPEPPDKPPPASTQPRDGD